MLLQQSGSHCDRKTKCNEILAVGPAGGGTAVRRDSFMF